MKDMLWFLQVLMLSVNTRYNIKQVPELQRCFGEKCIIFLFWGGETVLLSFTSIRFLHFMCQRSTDWFFQVKLHLHQVSGRVEPASFLCNQPSCPECRFSICLSHLCRLKTGPRFKKGKLSGRKPHSLVAWFTRTSVFSLSWFWCCVSSI